MSSSENQDITKIIIIIIIILLLLLLLLLLLDSFRFDKSHLVGGTFFSRHGLSNYFFLHAIDVAICDLVHDVETLLRFGFC